MKAANYNQGHSMNFYSRLRGCGWLLVLLAASAFAADWGGKSAELAKAIAAASGPGTITLSVVNASSLPKDQVAEIQHALEMQLRVAGVRIGALANANSDVRVTLSENLQGYVWVAEIKQGNDTHIEMVTVPRAQSVVVAKNAPSVVIRKALVWSQTSQILDMLLVDGSSSNPKMVVLDTDAISLYSLHDGKWQRDQNWAITHTRQFPRDLRGLLVAGKDKSMEAYLPGIVCNASVAANAVICRESDDAWKIGPRAAFFNSGRNYFTGALVPATDKAFVPFYSMAWLEKQNYPLAISTGTDGRVRLSDGVNDHTLSPAATSDWGSDIAAVKSSCGNGAQLLVTSNGDDNTSDSLRAYEFPDRDPVLASAAADLPGPITALWSHDNTSATAIARNLQTGQYEAYSVSISCNQ
jgi:hypothetical protein